MLGSFTANQCGAGLDTAFRHTANNGSDLLREVLAASDVVQEEQGLRAAADNVIDAHGNRIDADGIMLIHQHGKLYLGAAAVGTGDQNRLFHTGNGQTKAAAKAAHIVQAAFIFGALNVLLHQFNSLVTGGDIHTGCCIALRETLFHSAISF